MTGTWHEAALAKSHQRNIFDCGVPELNEFLRRYALQSHKSGNAKTYVATTQTDQIFGYYTLCPGMLEWGDAPAVVSRGLGRHPISVYRLARLAVDQSMQKRGIGSDLLLLAARRAMTAAENVGGIALLIDAKDEQAAAWYSDRFGALPLLSHPHRLLLPFAMVAAAINRAAPAL